LKSEKLLYGPVTAGKITIEGVLKKAVWKSHRGQAHPWDCKWHLFIPGLRGYLREAIGECAPDAAEAEGLTDVWCFPVGKRSEHESHEDFLAPGKLTAWHEWGLTGLILTRAGSGLEYKRVGVFVLNDRGEAWLRGSKSRIFDLI